MEQGRYPPQHNYKEKEVKNMVNFSKTPWSNFKDSDYNDDQWKNACLVVDTECLKNSTPKQCCKLPVKEPDGTYNINGIQAAYGALQGSRGGVKITDQQRQTAMNKVKSLYKQAGLNIPSEMKAAKSQPGGRGTIWAAGLHKPYVNDKPAKLYVPEETIPQAFQVMQEKIKSEGGIPLGIDHIPNHLLNAFPILKKLNLDDIGKATEIRTDGKRIYATKSEHTNPIIAELYARGDLPAYSIQASFDSADCPTGQADYVLKGIKDIKRIDYVNEGACKACKVGAVPDDMILTAKLSTEEKEMANAQSGGGNALKCPKCGATVSADDKFCSQCGAKLSGNTASTKNSASNQSGGKNMKAAVADPAKNEPIVDPKAAPTADPEPVADPDQDPEPEKELSEFEKLKADFNDFKSDFPNLISQAVNGETKEVKAQLNTMTHEAKKAQVESRVDAKIKEGFITRAQREMIVKAGLAYEDIKDFEKDLEGFKDKVWEPGQKSKTLKASKSDKEYTDKQFEEDYKKAYGTKPGA